MDGLPDRVTSRGASTKDLINVVRIYIMYRYKTNKHYCNMEGIDTHLLADQLQKSIRDNVSWPISTRGWYEVTLVSRSAQKSIKGNVSRPIITRDQLQKSIRGNVSWLISTTCWFEVTLVG